MLPCCTIDGEVFQPFRLEGEDAARWLSPAGPGLQRIEFIVPQASRPEAMAHIETDLSALPGVTLARVNLTGRRVAVVYRQDSITPQALIDRLGVLGYMARPFDPRETGLTRDDREGSQLLRALAVAGFAAGNVMLLSVSVWSGADAATRDLFHWLSALIALPAVAYAGRPFFRSAVNALRLGRVNMDVPISLGVLLAALMSLHETINGEAHAYFDAAVTLLFFLLAGRYLDHLMRARARSAIAQLVSLSSDGATIIDSDGSRRYVPARDLKAGMIAAVAAGDRLPADGIVTGGTSDMDRSLLTGESAPEAVKPGASVHAGELNLTGPLTVQITAAGNDTFLSELVRLMSAAEQGQSRYIRIADRLARFYSPAVHTLAAATLAGWVLLGNGWHDSIMAAVAVLIITCPCALGLAVPAVQVVASGRLFRSGIMIKDGAALEKLDAVDTVIFDKTGTLTRGEPVLVPPLTVSTATLALAAGLAQASKHPLSRALLREAARRGLTPTDVTAVSEHPGLGLSGTYGGEQLRLGSRAWCGLEDSTQDQGLLEFAFRRGASPAVVFQFEDSLRADAATTVAMLKTMGLAVHLLSGDREAAVNRVAQAVGIETAVARASPQAKLAYVEAVSKAGARVLMVGDGINDAPALAAGFTSMAPSTASDIGRTAAETVWMGESASAVATAIAVSRRSQRIAKENFALAVAYNVLAVPLAMVGLVSPLIAAVAMSSSSIIVIANALRAGRGGGAVVTAPQSMAETASSSPAALENAA
ncbi:heavy metal translocating P-type ATPase [Aestuariivirga sp.]|jgi:Cu2+-exporting ATPase|uniref:heavy metal translocating P-type ATPase n=1 Tax=Aestuariivirga sp. TaxID=2650926 RepID=UPI0037845248